MNRVRVWREKMTPNFEPKSAMGIALRYMRNQWPRLIAFLGDPKIPIHNNASEAALRIVALARKNSLFFGTEESGRRFMVLYSLIAMCERHDVNPEIYFADVLLRIEDHPHERRGNPRLRSQRPCGDGEVRGIHRSAPTVIAGDFNSTPSLDRPGALGHEALVAKLDELGLCSTYHAHRGERPGAELTPSFVERARSKRRDWCVRTMVALQRSLSDHRRPRIEAEAPWA